MTPAPCACVDVGAADVCAACLLYARENFPLYGTLQKTIDQRNRQVEHLENENRAIQFQVGEVYCTLQVCDFVMVNVCMLNDRK